MKFLIIAQRFHTNLYYRTIALQNAGHLVKVVVLYKGQSEFHENIDIQQIKLSSFSKMLLSLLSIFKKNNLKSGLELRIQFPGKELKRIIKSYKPDAILLKAYQNMLAIKTLCITRKRKIKVLMLTQTPFTHIKGSKFLFRLNIKLFKWLGVHAYITPIKINYDVFKNFGIKNVFYLPFVYPVKNSIKDKQANLPLKIISVGKYIKRKDQELLIEASKDLVKEGKVIIDFYGEVSDEEYFKKLDSMISTNNLEGKISLYKNINYQELQEKYCEYDIFVLPSYSEPAAYSIVEAMAHGLPIICSDQNGTSCYIDEGENGFVFEAKNKDNLSSKLQFFFASKSKLVNFSQNDIAAVKKQHSLTEFEKKIRNLVKENEI